MILSCCKISSSNSFLPTTVWGILFLLKSNDFFRSANSDFTWLILFIEFALKSSKILSTKIELLNEVRDPITIKVKIKAIDTLISCLNIWLK